MARTKQRFGFVPLDECLGAPHWSDASDLSKLIVAMDDELEIGFCYQQDQRQNRWMVIRNAPDGSQHVIRILQDESGMYMKPGQNVFLDLQKHRLAGPGGRQWVRDALTQEDRQRVAEEKAREEERAEMRDRAAKSVRDIRFKGRDTSKAFIE